MRKPALVRKVCGYACCVVFREGIPALPTKIVSAHIIQLAKRTSRDLPEICLKDVFSRILMSVSFAIVGKTEIIKIYVSK